METSTFSKKILAWYHKEGRKNLPWQENPTPYRVWISEIMLQQTQVSTVIPFFEKFMHRFPTISALAYANLDEVLHLWSGLGYYARARNLHKAALVMVEEFCGEFPSHFDNVRALPGIGRTTAGAILALSQEKRFPILDGNVKRVLTRFLGIEGFPGTPTIESKLWEYSEKFLPKKEIRHYTQALMDLGATLCTRTKPRCFECPIQMECSAKKMNKTEILPTKKNTVAKPIKETQVIIFYDEEKHRVLLEKRPPTGIWGGLFSFPEKKPDHLLPSVKKVTPFLNFRHTFTHFHMDISAYFYPLAQAKKLPRIYCNKTSSKEYLWQSLHTPVKVGIPAPMIRLFQELLCRIPSFA